MQLPLSIHLSIHFIVAGLVGLLAGKFFNELKIGIIAGIMGGFLIDLDHVLEYFFTFGLRFNFTHFFQGRQFLVSNRMLSIFHAWEYILVILLVIFLVRRYHNIKIFFITLVLSATVHLVSDCIINKFPPRNYSIIYRAAKGFNSSLLLDADQLEANNRLKRDLGL